MEMTIQEVKQLDKDSYQIIDIRDDNETVSYTHLTLPTILLV